MINNEWIEKDGNLIHKTAIILDNVIMGSGNKIMPNVVIGMEGFIRGIDHQDSKAVIIGDNNWIGINSAIMVGKDRDTIIGNDNLIMNYVNIGHDVVIGNDNEIGARTTIAGFVQIGDKNSIKISCTFRNRVIIGNSNLIGMGSLITKSFKNNNFKIYGCPARIIKEI